MNEDLSNDFLSFSLPRKVILRGKFFFDRLFQQGHNLYSDSLHLKFVLLAEDPTEFHIAFITPKRLGKAVIRNKARRRMREAFRLQQAEFTSVFSDRYQGVHCALICKNATTSYNDFHSDISLLRNKMNHFLTTKNS